MTSEAWIGLLSVAAIVLVAVVSAWVRIESKLSKLETHIENMLTAAKSSSADNTRLWQRTDKHDQRITRLETRLEH